MKYEDIPFPSKYDENFRLRIYYDLPKLKYAAVLYLNINSLNIIPVRIHSSCLTGDIFHSLKCDCNEQLTSALEYISNNKMGVLIYLPQEGRGIGLVNKIKAYKLQNDGLNTFEANAFLKLPIDNRDYSICSGILYDLNIHKILLLTDNPHKFNALYNSNMFTSIQYCKTDSKMNKYNSKYLKDKRIFFSNLKKYNYIPIYYNMPAKKKMNAYFKLMTTARKNNAKSFVYKGNTYSQMKTKSGMTVYKKK